MPVLCFRLDRAGKSIPEKFAERFIGPVACGVMLRAELKDRDIPHREFIENNLDYTTIIPYDLTPLEEARKTGSADSLFLDDEHSFDLRVNGVLQQSITKVPSLSELTGIFAGISRYCSIRTGDFLALELSEGFSVSPDSHLTTFLGATPLLDFLIK